MPRQARPWFRFYSAAVNNPKIQSLSGDLFKLYVNCLALANEHDPRGFLPRPGHIAFALRTDVQPLLDQLKELRRRSLLDGPWTAYRIHDWEEWNPDSDANLTPGRRGRNADRTPLERATHADRTHRGDTDTEQIQKQKPEQKQTGPPPYTPPVRTSCYKGFQDLFGRPITPMEGELIRALEDEHPEDRIFYALEAAGASGVRNVKYVKAICEAQETAGDNRDAGKPMARNGTHVNGLTESDRAQLARLGVGAKREVILD